MRVIILNREKLIFIVVVRVTNVPIQHAIQFKRHSRFGRLKRYRIGIDEDHVRRRDAVALTLVLINVVSGEERQPRSGPDESIEEEKIVARVVLALAHASLTTDWKQDSRDTRHAHVGVTTAQRELRIRRPIN